MFSRNKNQTNFFVTSEVKSTFNQMGVNSRTISYVENLCELAGENTQLWLKEVFYSALEMQTSERTETSDLCGAYIFNKTNKLECKIDANTILDRQLGKSKKKLKKLEKVWKKEMYEDWVANIGDVYLGYVFNFAINGTCNPLLHADKLIEEEIAASLRGAINRKWLDMLFATAIGAGVRKFIEYVFS